MPRRRLKGWVCLMHEVGLLRLPVVFGRAHASFVTLSEGGAVATMTANDYYRTAASEVEMRPGRHFAQFTVVTSNGSSMFFGVVRPGCNVEGGASAYNVDGQCFYYTYSGRRWPGGSSWEGMQHAREQGDRIGMLLDLDQGSMTVWKNDVKLGVMVTEGLSGEFCWAVELFGGGDSARIEPAPLPEKRCK